MDETENNFVINIFSFGYKYGVIDDVNFLQDVRFLPNPYYVENLKNKNGMCKEVRDYVESSDEAKKYFNYLFEYLLFYISKSKDSNKNELKIAFGCTGGKHRSVTAAYKVYELLLSKGYSVNLYNRDIDKG